MDDDLGERGRDDLERLGDLFQIELDLARKRSELVPILEEYGIIGAIHAEMLADPERALRVLDHVRRSSSVRNPAALANALWRQSALQLTQTAAPLPPKPRDDYEEGLPSLSVIEHAWSFDPSPMADSLLAAMAAALGRGGGFNAIRETFARSDYWELDDDGNLLTTNPDWIRTGPDDHDRLLERKPNQ